MLIPPEFRSRDSQTRIKHAILHAYAGAWASIIAGGIGRRTPGAHVSFAFVDGFAGAGRYGRDTDGPPNPTNPVWGSPIIGTRAILAGLKAAPANSELSAICVEDSDENYRALIDNCGDSALPLPLTTLQQIADAKRGHLSLVHADFRRQALDLLKWLGRSFALLFIDPYGTGMPMDVLAPLVGRPATDAIVLFPVFDVDRKSGSARKAGEDLSPGDRGNITRVRNVFGCDDWEPIADDDTLSLEERERFYVELYASRLKAISPELVVKTIALRLSSMDRTGYNLFLTTRDPSGALRMNEILRRAEFREHYTLWADYQQRRKDREEEQGIMSFVDMLGGLEPPPSPAPIVVEPADVADLINRRCPAGEYTIKQIQARLADDPFTESEMNAALRYMKRQGQVKFEGDLKRVATVVRLL